MLKHLCAACLIASLSLAGCGPAKLNPAALKAMHRVALISTTLAKVDNNPGNARVQQAAADYATKAYQDQLAKVPGWQLVPAPDLQQLDDAFANLADSQIAKDTLLQLAEQDKLPGKLNNALIMQLAVASMTGNQKELERLKGELIGSTLQELQTEMERARNGLAWSSDMAGIPYNLGGGEGIASALLDVRHRLIQAYRQQHNLDGVIVVHQATRVGEPGDIRIIVQNNRVLSSLKLNPVIEVYSAEGLAYSSGSPRLDDLAPLKLAMPIYTGTPGPRGVMQDFQLDLNDPKGTSSAGYRELVDETAPKAVGKLIKMLQ